MKQSLTPEGDKGINMAFITFIPFSTSAGGEGDKGINPYKVYPVSPHRIAGCWNG